MPIAATTIAAATSKEEIEALGDALKAATAQGKIGLEEAGLAALALKNRLREITEQNDPLADSFAKLGIKSQKALDDARDAERDAFEAIVTGAQSGKASTEDVRRAFVAYAQAAGYPDRRVVWVYVLRNSLVATTTQIGLLFGALVSSAVAVEAIYDWPGIGSYAVQAILSSDYKAILAVTLVVGVIYAAVNILVDVAQALLDPRVAETL